MRTKSYQDISEDIASVLNGLPDGLPPPGALRRIAEAVLALTIHVESHERRIDAGKPPLRCRYTDCAEGHPQAGRGEQITCHTCRQALGLQETAAASDVRDLQKEISRLQDALRDQGAAHVRSCVRSCAHETELEKELHKTRYALDAARAESAKLYELMAAAEAERDAASAKVTELTRWLEWQLAKTGGGATPMATTCAAPVRAAPDDKDAAQTGVAVLVLPKADGTDRTHE